MSKQEKKRLVPTLRFPEFRDKSGWEKKKLGEFIFTITPPKKLLTTDYLPSGQFPVIDQSQNYICGWTSDDEAIITDNLPLIVFGDHTCILKMVDRPFAQGADGIKIFKPNDSVKTEFLYQSLQFQPLVMEQYKRHFSILKDREVAYPDRKSGEQQKIADCLSSLDELITLETQRLGNLKSHKKGLMQQLFPTEGETVPKLRFPEFRGAGGWEKIPIGKIGEIVTGNTPSTTVAEYYGGDRLFVSPGDMADHRFIYNTKTTLTELGYSKTRQIPAGSILFVCIGSTIGKVAQNKIDCATNQQINAVVPFENYSSGFIYYSLDLNASNIAELAGKQAVPIINKTVFSTVVLDLPSFNEQQLIVECLSSLDEVISAQNEKLEALKTHKKGLMQRLFPSADGVPA